MLHDLHLVTCRAHSLHRDRRSSLGGAWVITRQVFDCGDPNGDTACYLDFLQDGHFYGRSEGQPARGPNPNHLISNQSDDVFGSTDVDTLYNRLNQLHQYYTTKLGRNGPNGLGGTGNGTTVPNTVYRAFANANWSTTGQTMCGGETTPGGFASTTAFGICKGSVNRLDLIGHEAAHILFASELGATATITGEAGALNEGMSDFFGEALERFLTESNDWVAFGVRSLADPTLAEYSPGISSPDRYLHPNYYTGTQDSGGVHFNAGIIGKAAYLAVEGGTFNGFEIAGIGFDKVEQIWYRSIATYFDSTETFNEAYVDIIHAADDLYGLADVLQMTLVLRAVEMHRIRDQPEPLLADYDQNGTINGLDFLAWQRGDSPNPFTERDLAAWIASIDPYVDLAPFEALLNVPEPASATLLLFLIVGRSLRDRSLKNSVRGANGLLCGSCAGTGSIAGTRWARSGLQFTLLVAHTAGKAQDSVRPTSCAGMTGRASNC